MPSLGIFCRNTQQMNNDQVIHVFSVHDNQNIIVAIMNGYYFKLKQVILMQPVAP